jgi:2',3'-cyclic-nucleotide 2'-phosphodiesterase (5'-nucleotidase family)
MPDFTLLHTNDHHNHFTEAHSARLSLERAELGSNGLLLDAGDAVGSGNVTFRPGGEPVLDLMNAAGYDAMTIGNREFHFSRVGFQTKISRANFPVLCANVRPKDGGEPLTVPSVSFSSGGKRIVIFGLTVPMITERMLVRKVSAFVFDDPLAIGKELAQKLRPEADLLICLSHIGLKKDRALAEATPEIDLIIGGHTHATLPEGERVGNTLIVQAGSFSKLLGTVDINWTEGAPSLTANLRPL